MIKMIIIIAMTMLSLTDLKQEDADTKVLLCAQFGFDISFERDNILIVDTDVRSWECIFSPCLMERLTFNMGHNQQRQSINSLKIHWIEVLFKLCLVWMLLVVLTQLAVLKRRFFEEV